MLDWNSLLDDRVKMSDLLVVPNVEVSLMKHLKRGFDEGKIYILLYYLAFFVKMNSNVNIRFITVLYNYISTN